jgi:hypothetical protein
MQLTHSPFTSHDYAKCIEVSKRVRWDIDNDVIRGRQFDFSQKFLPDGISKVDQFDFLTREQKILLSQIQGRTYANMFGFVERFITAKVLELTRDHWLGDQVAPEALIRFSDEELKHQALFRRIEKMMADGILQTQRTADAEYFLEVCKESSTEEEIERVESGVLKAYRWQYIFSGVAHPRFQKLFVDPTTEDQRQRINTALASLS